MKGNGLVPKLPFLLNACKADITASLSLSSSANGATLTGEPKEGPAVTAG